MGLFNIFKPQPQKSQESKLAEVMILNSANAAGALLNWERHLPDAKINPIISTFCVFEFLYFSMWITEMQFQKNLGVEKLKIVRENLINHILDGMNLFVSTANANIEGEDKLPFNEAGFLKNYEYNVHRYQTCTSFFDENVSKTDRLENKALKPSSMATYLMDNLSMLLYDRKRDIELDHPFIIIEILENTLMTDELMRVLVTIR